MVPRWVAYNLALGYFIAYPLTVAVVLSYYVRAKVWGTVAAPFHAAEATAAVAVMVVMGGTLIVTSVLVNRALRRRLRALPALGFWPAAVAIQLAPFTWFLLGTSGSFDALVTMGLFG